MLCAFPESFRAGSVLFTLAGWQHLSMQTVDPEVAAVGSSPLERDDLMDL
jgi:hypothetical protein